MKTLKQFLEGKDLTMEKFEEMEAKEKAAIFNELNEENSTAFKELEESVESNSKEVNEALKELGKIREDQFDVLKEALKEQGIILKKLTEKEKEEKDALKSGSTSIYDALKANKDRLTELAGKGENGNEGVYAGQFSFKVAADMLISTNVSGGNVPVEQRIAGFDVIASRRIRLMDLVSRGTAVSDVISWVSQANKDGSAGGTAEGATKNKIDFDLVVDSESVKKRTAFVRVSDEMVDDIEFMTSEINNELMRELMKDIENQVYQGDGTGTNLNGIRTVSTAFAGGTFANTVDNANKVDVLRVAMNQVAIAEQGEVTAILMHPSDITSLLLDKVTTTDKRYLAALQEIGSSKTLDGVSMIGTTLVTVDDYQIGNFPMATVWDKGAIDIQVGLDGNDFTQNMRTIRAEWRGLVIIKTNDRTAFVDGDFTTDEAVLETP